MCVYSYGTPHMVEQKQDVQLEHTFSSYVRIRDVALKTWQRRLTIGRSGERGSRISVLAARHDDDDDVCVYENMCVCAYMSECLWIWVCVCVYNRYLSLNNRQGLTCHKIQPLIETDLKVDQKNVFKNTPEISKSGERHKRVSEIHFSNQT